MIRKSALTFNWSIDVIWITGSVFKDVNQIIRSNAYFVFFALSDKLVILFRINVNFNA